MAEASARRLVATLTLLATLMACSESSPSGLSERGTTSTAFSRTVTVSGLTFTLPDELQYRTDGFASSFAAFEGFYGTVPLGPSCVTVGTTSNCGFVEFAPLPPGAVVIGLGELPGPELLVGGAPNTSVAGIPSASRETTGGGVCDKTIYVEIRDTEQTLHVSVCLVGPDISQGEAMLQQLLDSVVLSD